MKVLYTDFDPFLCAWLENLIAGGCLASGDVLCRDVRDISPEDVRGYDIIHWFCGIGGWPLALQIAGWPDDLPVWTASLPCQPFSVAGKQLGEQDERHLWPTFRRLVAELLPPVVLGEQVASPLGRQWLAAVRSDLEKLGYAVGAADIPAAGVGAHHMRHRLWWGAVRLAESARVRRQWRRQARERWSGPAYDVALGHAHSDGRAGTDLYLQSGQSGAAHADAAGAGALCHADGTRLERRAPRIATCQWPAWTAGPDWLQRADWWLCADEKLRPFESGIFPVADGIPGRVAAIRAAGNAIVPQVGAVFVEEFMEAMCESFQRQTPDSL